ncbi:hypothetical protein Hypma_007709 [Hypsizygus marmoreus]|uniref:Ribonuclease H2 subunit B n=1 Tax=Hypsizygus marmoreus TaxID=39966 RepID=A0A369JSP2_HYPMA|nr:hypothetical protein Hypma_007709 [Hypsizygus marmoreus]
MTTHIVPDVMCALSIALEHKQPVAGLPFLRLCHPRTGIPSLFLLSESFFGASSTRSAILEVQAIAPPDTRSWFIGEEVIGDGKFLLMTPIDPVFLLIPILGAAHPNDGSPGTYRPADDILEEAAHRLQTDQIDGASSIFPEDITRFGSLACVKDAMGRICDIKEVTSEIVVYRLSRLRILEYLRMKVTRLVAPEVLEVSRATIRGLAKEGLLDDGKDYLLQLGRLRAACNLLGQYLSPDLRALLFASYDFTELDAHSELIAQEAAAVPVAVTKGKAKEKAPIGEKKRGATKGSQGVEKLKKPQFRLRELDLRATFPQPFRSVHLIFAPLPAFLAVMSLVGPQEKSYHDKFTQTDQDFLPQSHAQFSETVPQGPRTLPMATTDHLDSFKGTSSMFGPAYTYPESSDQWSTSPKVSPSLPHSTLHLPQHPQRYYSRPTQSAALRVVSLPGVSSDRSSKLRVVSLPPGLAIQQLSPEESPADESSSLEYLATSADTSCHSSRDESVHQNIRTFLPSDMPATPSPSSSPESVLFTGKGSYVGRSTPHQRNCYESRPYDTTTDSGWITWATSPPRPIPALHGPLSLPYARCPSGAEGTIIEDADPPPMIWGLPLQESNRGRHHSENPAPVSNARPLRRGLETFSSVTLETSASKHGLPLVDTDDYAGRCMVAEVRSPHMKDIGIQLANLRMNRSKPQDPLPHHPPNAHQTLNKCFSIPGNHSNVDVLTPPASHRGPNPKTSKLNSSAPTFVPVTRLSQNNFPRNFVEPHAGSRSMHHGQSATTTIQGFLREPQQSYLPTPPNSSEPQWSPTFLKFPASSNQYQQVLYPPLPELSGPRQYPSSMIDLSEDLHRFATQREMVPSTLDTAYRADNLRPLDASSEQSFPFSSVMDVSQTNKYYEPFLSFERRTNESPAISLTRPVLKLSSTPNLLSHPPQSIPLARLIQRRLSRSSIAVDSIQHTTSDNALHGLRADPAIYRKGPFLRPRSIPHPLTWKDSHDLLGGPLGQNSCVDDKSSRSVPLKKDSKLPMKSAPKAQRTEQNILCQRNASDEAKENTNSGQSTVDKGRSRRRGDRRKHHGNPITDCGPALKDESTHGMHRCS